MSSLNSTIQQLADYDTALIANTIGYLDSTPPHEWYMSGDIHSLTPTIGPTVGVAMTCEMDTSTPNSTPSMDLWYDLLKAIQASKEPVVLVVKAVGSRPEHECIFGDGMAKMLASVGCVGAVTDGGCRDIEGIMTVPFPIYARGRTIHHCALRITHINRTIEIGGIKVSPGEVIHANIGGVIKVPQGCLEKMPERAAAMTAFEHEAHIIWRQKEVSIDEKKKVGGQLLKKYGFDVAHPPRKA